MKLISTILLSFLALSSYAEAPDEFEINYVKNYLRSYAPGYPQRRAEAFRIMNSVNYDARQEIYQIILDNDLSFMSLTDSFEDLWKLRHQNKWEPEVLYAVAKAACFYVKFCSEQLKTGSSRDLGIINEIMNALRDLRTPQANRALIQLVDELQKLQQFEMARRGQAEVSAEKETFKKAILEAIGGELVEINQKRFQIYLNAAKAENAVQ